MKYGPIKTKRLLMTKLIAWLFYERNKIIMRLSEMKISDKTYLIRKFISMTDKDGNQSTFTMSVTFKETK